VATRLTTLTFKEVEVGHELPELAIELTPTLIVSTAIATRDYQDVHHDRDLAKQKGSEDIFMNILTTNGFVGRFITDWAGPESLLKHVAIRLGAPNYPYDTMRMTGVVTKKEVVNREGTVEVDVRGANSRGDHVVGTVRLVLPS
jgi:acyl dehydratase